jgi:phosphoglycolate phosphatase-like HAD superfamily hydrolase
MRPSPQAQVLYLDFDGVLCDSLEECFRSSWLARSGIPIGPQTPPDPPFDAAYRRQFDACRPFIRSGEDYLVVHEWAARGAVPSSQADFDASLASHGPDVMAVLKTKLYATRDALLAHHLDLWLSWNPLYDGIAEVLAAQAQNDSVWILSTKKAEFIGQILAHHGVPWPLERTLYTGTRKKLAIIDERSPAMPSALIDDQVDHLDFDHPRCQCYLALWGYVPPGAAAQARAALTLPQALDLISSFRPARRDE